ARPAPSLMPFARSWHFVPAHRPEFFEKAFATAADAPVFERKEGVPDAERDAARENLRRELPRRSAAERARCWIRVNAGAAEFRRDLLLLRRARCARGGLPAVEDGR